MELVDKQVRKHRAPKGALRHAYLCIAADDVVAGQKAPSAKRCIKTGGFASSVELVLVRRSESTERQKVH